MINEKIKDKKRLYEDAILITLISGVISLIVWILYDAPSYFVPLLQVLLIILWLLVLEKK